MTRSTEEDVDPAAPIPARTERRTDTTRVDSAQSGGPEDLSGPEARLPHERDEAIDMTGGARHPEMEQAFEDLQRGLRDTDRGVPAHNAHQKQK